MEHSRLHSGSDRMAGIHSWNGKFHSTANYPCLTPVKKRKIGSGNQNFSKKFDILDTRPRECYGVPGFYLHSIRDHRSIATQRIATLTLQVHRRTRWK
jgi:hypothetical protein